MKALQLYSSCTQSPGLARIISTLTGGTGLQHICTAVYRMQDCVRSSTAHF
jgi:hypothetical protein